MKTLQTKLKQNNKNSITKQTKDNESQLKRNNTTIKTMENN